MFFPPCFLFLIKSYKYMLVYDNCLTYITKPSLLMPIQYDVFKLFLTHLSDVHRFRLVSLAKELGTPEVTVK